MTQYARPDDNVDYPSDWTDDAMLETASYTMIDQDPVGDCSVYIMAMDMGVDLTVKFELNHDHSDHHHIGDRPSGYSEWTTKQIVVDFTGVCYLTIIDTPYLMRIPCRVEGD